ncbi:MAG: cation:proton antiporter [Bacteroidales bacterium]|nr:cation:proton antiporter [Bacteroidales bacterium]
MDDLKLVADLALILVSAGAFTIISRALKQPLVLGYIIAGILVGPHIGLFPTVTSTDVVERWSEIGVIFMMFGLGLEFSFKKLLKVGASALIIAGCKFIGLFIVGFAVGLAMGWTTMESMFLGGLLSMSSTAVVLKAYEDMGLKNKPFAATVFGTLVVEDIIAIILMVVFSTVAVSKKFEGGEMLFNLTKLVFFLILWFLVGIYLIPTLLKKSRKWLNDEILLIVSIGLCFGMVSLATSVGFSAALGAFVMGSILAETLEGEHIVKLTGGIKNLFSAVFFVSVGMMVDPRVIVAHWLPVLVITLLVIVGHILFAAGGSLLAGKDLETSVKTGFSLSQLGEFGFILAGVGVGLGVMRDFTYPVIVTVSVITTFTTPYMIKLAGPVEAMLRRRMPQKWVAFLDQPGDRGRQSTASMDEWRRYLTSFVLRIVLYSVLLFALLAGCRAYFAPFMHKVLSSLRPAHQDVLIALSVLVLMTPFLLGIVSRQHSEKESAKRLIALDPGNRRILNVLRLLKAAVALIFLLAMLAIYLQSYSKWVIPVVLVAGLLVSYLLFRSNRHLRDFISFEDRFVANLNARETQEREEDESFKAMVSEAAPEEIAAVGLDRVAVEAFTLGKDSFLTGRTLREVDMRKYGCMLVSTQRGDEFITNPKPDRRFKEGDVVWIAGEKSSMDILK